MYQPNNQITVHATALSIQDSSALKHVGQNDSCVIASDEIQNGALCKAESIVYNSKKLQDDLQMLGLKIKQHENNIKLLKTQKNSLDDSILDMQVSVGKYQSSSVHMTENEDLSHIQSEEETVEHILRHEKSAAGILCQLKTRHGTQASHLPLSKDVLGIVATLGKVDDDNLSRLLSEYLGMETISGLHGLGASIGRSLDGRFLVICLESLRPYVGEFVADDPQRRLDPSEAKIT
ncbi:hypothetical protein F0562_026739 [Nyssa sinensis]|uniref:Uncharacterized protein n=1 Tax=Nyssa sinensis TaxID=561372 RepID=A0A5J5BE92_9ASTE|nr:hypothetical protein F0562_026739 [Nyssa sinensis]